MLTIRKTPLLASAALLATTLFFGGSPTLHAQFTSPGPVQSAAPETYDFDLGNRQATGATYSVKSTQPLDSKLKSQRIRFSSIVTTLDRSTTRYLTVNTGKYKTVGQMSAYLREVFAKFLAGAPANTEVGKIGDIKFGGEVHFVVQSPDVLLYNTMTAGEPEASMALPRAEVMAYASILAGEPVAKQ